MALFFSLFLFSLRPVGIKVRSRPRFYTAAEAESKGLVEREKSGDRVDLVTRGTPEFEDEEKTGGSLLIKHPHFHFTYHHLPHHPQPQHTYIHSIQTHIPLFFSFQFFIHFVASFGYFYRIFRPLLCSIAAFRRHFGLFFTSHQV
ncbi:hypothetical protein QVD17_28869 [Tagetes erecta]|uniref:Uncharacterized protein n=1 Tax=Tagetes erecta TaxID=13708 RepID=A0AAD8NKT1_TARER|nr:hypothetical protein QVD17_28869 [Tagetes erecta]